MQLSQNEIKIVEKLRAMKPYQKMEIMADGSGKPDTYVVTQAFKEKLTSEGQVQFLHVTLKIKE